MPKDDFKFHCTLRVRWSECDAQRIAYNAAYLAWNDVAQAEYLRNLGLGLYKLAELNIFDTVLVKVTLEYKAPARVDDLVEVYARVAHMGTSSIDMEFEVYRKGQEDPLTRVESIYASYDNRAQRTRPIPEEVRRLFSHFEETGQPLPMEQLPTLAQTAEERRESPEPID